MSRIGRYEIVSELGRGAMGVVYLANDPHLHRQGGEDVHAARRNHRDLARQFRERFLREARAAASLSQDEATGVS